MPKIIEQHFKEWKGKIKNDVNPEFYIPWKYPANMPAKTNAFFDKNCKKSLSSDCTERNTKGCSADWREIMPDKNWDLQKEMMSNRYVKCVGQCKNDPFSFLIFLTDSWYIQSNNITVRRI